jgi:hypothetical protein
MFFTFIQKRSWPFQSYLLHRTIMSVFISWLLVACSSPANVKPVEHQSGQTSKRLLPAIGLVVSSIKSKNQRICVDGQYGGRNCFVSQDQTPRLILNQVKASLAFRDVTPISFTSSKSPHRYILHLHYTRQLKRTDGLAVRAGKLLVQAMSIFLIPVNMDMHHSLQARIYENGSLVFTQSYQREGIELTSLVNSQANQDKAVASMLNELVTQLHDEAVLTEK